ncbi:S9 family peptidase [Chitinophaga lutea]|uniref:S9 family peptidase n=1 Tax=Chitinophaga lutea TaxID=2488634 RepID=A0A3N4Q444_9BACT|nr:prolyl oligopeptidase family serine peptidase [Chitinophaga lutea]RPE12241.1 S9 family peptidase [Chitinophaga lutea]
MKIIIASMAGALLAIPAYAQQLTVEKIMRDPKWIGTSPDNITWGGDSKTVFFSWNPEKAYADSLYSVGIHARTPVKTKAAERGLISARNNAVYNQAQTQRVYAYQGDVFFQDMASGKETRITRTADPEQAVGFSFNDTRVIFRDGRNLFAWDPKSGETEQLTNFVNGAKPSDKPAPLSPQHLFLQNQQQQLFEVLRERKARTDAATAFNKSLPDAQQLRALHLEDKSLADSRISPDGRFIAYRLFKMPAGEKSTIVPNYVTETGYTTDIPAYTKTGAERAVYDYFVYDRVKDTVLTVKLNGLPGIQDKPDYLKDYPGKDTARKSRSVVMYSPVWSPKGTQALVNIVSTDNKDRWIMLLDAATAKMQLVDRQRDEAWIGGPGVSNANMGWINENTCYFQSEVTGYSHLYTYNVANGQKKALTSGNYEVQEARLSRDKNHFYLLTNEVNPGEKQYYRLPVTGGKAERLTTMPGAHSVSLSPDEKWLAYRYSTSNKPWELYLQENKAGAKPVQITDQAQSPEFKAYPWREANVITFKARDNEMVPARLYTPDPAKKNGAAVIFVHGAGYLQNAHKWWSQYFREYMFHNLLTDLGYTVLDIDYRGSAGYGRNWRTGIYRHMGGKDLTDQVDGARYLAQQHGVDPKRIGIYGGSYGGFITLMAMFTTPDDFAAGAALRSVTDWAHYNDGYTSNILNRPAEDSIAFRRSSPIYFAEGLKGHLLMCHGMVDVNVHFQDIVRLSQRLIELGKNNWELAVYPVEDHGFVEPSSWTDEYKRILTLFERVLQRR